MDAYSPEEVLVTAQKRTERLQDVPAPVTVVDTDTLADRDQDRLRDYFASVPGLTLNTGASGSGQQFLAIRGVTTSSGGNPTVGVTIDDVPYGSSTFLGLGNALFPDLDPSDLARIEVLKGPQGALYGAQSMGGLIKFVTKDPSPDSFTGRLQAVSETVERGEWGYGLRGAVNAPISDTLALRASVFARRDPGYVDNILTGNSNANRADVYGGRFSTLWRPSETLSLKLGALFQHTEGFGTAAVDANSNIQPVLGDLNQERMLGTEQYDVKAALYSAVLNAKIRDLDFISVTGFGDNKYLQVIDQSLSFRKTAEKYFGTSGAAGHNSFETKKFSEEFRLSSGKSSSIEWLVGLFFTHENTPADQSSYAVDPTTGQNVGLIIDFNFPTTVSEYAAFGDITYHLTDRFDIQIGGRESRNRQIYDETDSGQLAPVFYGGHSVFINPTEHDSGNAFTYLATPSFKVLPDLLVYGRLTSGYRVGGNNLNAVFYQIPGQFGPDKTVNYEIGLKGSILDGAMTFDTSVYYISWKQIQIILQNATGDFTTNGGNAKSQGVEWSLQAHPLKGLSVALAGSINDAELTQDLPAASTAFGRAGDRLPFSSRFSGNLSADQDIPIAHGWTAFFGGSVSYLSVREGDFTGNVSSPRIRLPAFGSVDFRIGTRTESLKINMFVNNATDRRGILGAGGAFAQSTYSIVYTQPLTVGLSVDKSF